jgi:hypothetical protein
MPKPMIRIHNVETGEIIDREMTTPEIKAHQASASALKTLEDATASKATTKIAILERLGITAEEAQAIFG